MHPAILFRKSSQRRSICILDLTARLQGISQCLITARLGFVQRESVQTNSLTTPMFASAYIVSPGDPATPQRLRLVHSGVSGESKCKEETEVPVDPPHSAV